MFSFPQNLHNTWDTPAVEALKAQRTGQAQERLIPSHTWRDEGFPNSVGGVWDPNKVGQAFRAAMKRAGLEEHQRGLHTLRHSTASRVSAKSAGCWRELSRRQVLALAPRL